MVYSTRRGRSKFHHEPAIINHAGCGRMELEYFRIMMHIRGANSSKINTDKRYKLCSVHAIFYALIKPRVVDGLDMKNIKAWCTLEVQISGKSI